MWLCLSRKSRPFRCHKTRRHTSMMILLLLLSGDVEINPGPVTGRSQSEQGGPSSQPSTVPHPPHPEPTPPSSTLDDERSRKLKQVHGRLKGFYEKQHTVRYAPKSMQFINLATVEQKNYCVKRKKDVSDFLQATIHGIDKYYNTSKKIKYEDILNCGEVISGKRVVISGAPGCGKTTLSHKLCKDLYSQSLPNQYSLVLLVELRRLRLYLDSVEVDIDLQFLLSEFQRVLNLPELCQSLEERDGEGVALILDGFDEVPDQLGSSPFISELLSRVNPYLSKCDVFVTTRPSRIPDLISLIQKSHRHVEILGFTDTDINEYIKSFFAGVHPNDRGKAVDKSDKLIRHLTGRPSVRGMCRIPRVLEIICKVQEHIGSDHLPGTPGGIYSKYICHELSKCQESLTCPIENALNVPEDQFPGFYPLCEVAYKCCIDREGQRLILTDDDLGDVKRYLDKRDSIYNLLFSEYVDEIAPIVAVLYQLNHKTVQETLAAVHIARQSESDQEMIWKEEFHRPEMAEVWKVYCNLTKLKNVDLKELSYSVLSEHAREVLDQEVFRDDDMVVMTSLFEADNSSLSREILRDLFKTSITAEVRSSYEAQVVRYSLQHHPTLPRLQIWANSTADNVFTDELMPTLMPRLRELRCDQLSESDCTTLSKAFVKARHLETIMLPMKFGVGERNVPYMEKAVLSALTKLPALKTLTLDMDRYQVKELGIKEPQEDRRRIVEALEANICLREFHLKSMVYHPGLSIIIEHLCRNETLSEVTIDLGGECKVPVQLWKSLLVHREKCTVKMSLTRQQWCAVLSGLREAKKLKELVVHMHERDISSSISDQSDQCLISSDEVKELVATSEQLVKVEVGHDPSSISEAVGDLMLSMVKGVSGSKNVSELGVVFQGYTIFDYGYDSLDSTRSVVVPILEIIARHTKHITCVRFKCTVCPLVTLLGDDWCQLLVDGPMSKRECHLKLNLTPAKCGQLLSRVNDTKGLEELSVKISRSRFDKRPHSVRDVTVKAVEEVYSYCRLRKMRLQIGILVSCTNLLVAVVRGIAFNNNDIDFVLEGYALNGDDIMSQLPPQSVERFEFVERRWNFRRYGFIITKPCAPTVPSFSPSTLSLPLTAPEAERCHVSSAPKKSSLSSTSRVLRVPVISLTKKMSTPTHPLCVGRGTQVVKRRLPLQASSPLSPAMSVGVTQAANKSSSPSSTQLSQPPVSLVTKSRIPLPTSSTSSLRRKFGITSSTEMPPSLSQLSQTQISSVMNTKSTPSARCSTERGPPTSNPIAKRRLPLQASSPLSPAMSVGVTQAANKSSSPSSTPLSQPPVSLGTKSRIPLPTSSTSSLRRNFGITSSTETSPSLSQIPQTRISSVMNTKSTPSARCSTERGPPTSNPTSQGQSIKSPSDFVQYMDKMIADLPLLGTVLGIEDYTSAIMKEPGDPQSRCINILSHWLKVTPHPTWTMFCDRLKRAKVFNNLRSEVCQDKLC